MAGLVSYASSDEDDESQEEHPPQTSANTHKTQDSRTAHNAELDKSTEPQQVKDEALRGKDVVLERKRPSPAEQPADEAAAVVSEAQPQATEILIGPSRPPADAGHALVSDGGGDGGDDGGEDDDGYDEAPLSPYSAERARLRAMTMPRVPDFDIPGSPPGSPPPSSSALNKKFETFLALKRTKQTHFNARLAQSSAMRNPALMDKLMAFVGLDAPVFDRTAADDDGGSSSISGRKAGDERQTQQAQQALAAQYGTTLPEDIWNPAALPSWAYRTPLRKAQEEMARQRARGPGERVEFVVASGSTHHPGSGSSRNSRSGTPLAATGSKRKARNE